MTYKTILLHVNDERRVAGLVAAASLLATRYEAHLIGLYVMPPVPTYGVTSVCAGMIKARLGTVRDEAKRVQAAFGQSWRHPDRRDRRRPAAHIGARDDVALMQNVRP